MKLQPKYRGERGHARLGVGPTWTPKVCRTMAFWAILMGLGLLFYIPLGFR